MHLGYFVRVGMVIACALLVGAPASYASQVSLSSGTVTVAASPGELNDVNVNLDEEISDSAGITPGPGCTALSPTKVTCGYNYETGTQEDNWSTLVVNLGDGDDSFLSSMVQLQRTTVDAGDGNDIVQGTDANLIGTVAGGAGNDRLDGTSADDNITGGPGDDTIEGGRGNDTIDAGAGRDTVVGDSTADSLAQGNDRLFVRDGEVDQVSCEGGSDTVQADRDDVVEEFLCESVDRPANQDNNGGDGGDDTPPDATLSGKKTQKLGKTVVVGVRCDDGACTVTATGTVKVPAACGGKRFQLGKARKSLAQGATAKVKPTLSKKTRKAVKCALQDDADIRAKLKLKFEAAAGNVTTLRRKIALKLG